MSGAYVFVSGGSQDAYTDLYGASYDQSNYYRYALLYIENLEVAKQVAKYLDQNHGLSADVCDDWREFEAIRETELSDDDFLKTIPLRDPKLVEKRSNNEDALLELAQEVQKHIQKRLKKAVKEDGHALDETSCGEVASSNAPTGKSSNGEIVLDSEDLEILKNLNERPHMLLVTVQIAANTNISRKTVALRLSQLIGLGLAHRPRGKRSGATITARGRALIAQTPSKS
ncbi:MAG: hypothetical protein KAV87_34170 [Desulfobacteraceae bacterium]|nr:hypothetical protein [Desulfobacteraceae bacterium]